MIVRDKFGIIVQHPDMDEGDSASRTGIMALCGSHEDQELLWLFTHNLTFVRHPFAEKWNKASQLSRDQLVCIAAGTTTKKSLLLKETCLAYANKWFCNKDFLDPGVRLFLYKCARAKAPWHIRLLGPIFLRLSILWTCLHEKEELNQLLCICIVMQGKYLTRLYEWHPSSYKNVMDYWGGWRDQAEIGSKLYGEFIRRYTNDT